jgi:phage-related protein
MTQARKTLYATVGAGEAVIERVKSLPKQAGEIRSRLTDGSLLELPKTTLDAAKSAPSKVTELFSSVTEKVGDLTAPITKRATKNFNTYAKRGEKLVKKITKSASARRAGEKNRSAKSRTKAAATTIRSAVEADVEAVKHAAETVAADVG